jgi:hypothetical protein
MGRRYIILLGYSRHDNKKVAKVLSDCIDGFAPPFPLKPFVHLY